MKENQKNNQSKQIMLSVLAVAILIILVVGVSLAVFTYTGRGNENNTITTGSIILNYSEDTNGIRITDAVPMSDAEGKAIPATNRQVFDFTVSATISSSNGSTIDYSVTAAKQASTLENKDVKLYLEKSTDGGSIYSECMAPKNFTPEASQKDLVPENEMELYTGTFNQSGTEKFRLRMWIDEHYSEMALDKSFTVTVNVYGSAD